MVGVPCFAAMQFREAMHFGGGADRLADLERNQLANDEIAEYERERESSDRRRDGAERDVGEDIEPDELAAQNGGGNTSSRDSSAGSDAWRILRALARSGPSGSPSPEPDRRAWRAVASSSAASAGPITLRGCSRIQHSLRRLRDRGAHFSDGDQMIDAERRPPLRRLRDGRAPIPLPSSPI